MAIIRFGGFLGFGEKQRVHCDRCGQECAQPYWLCSACFLIPPQKLRGIDLTPKDTYDRQRAHLDYDAPTQCAICADTLYSTHAKQCCHGCAIRHPDASHWGVPDWAYQKNDMSDGISHCRRCGGVQVVTGKLEPDSTRFGIRPRFHISFKSGVELSPETEKMFRTVEEENNVVLGNLPSAKLSYRYHRVGLQSPQTTPFVCQSGANSYEAASSGCVHSYLVIASRLTGKIGRAQMDRSAMGLLGYDEIDLQYLHEGCEHYWCWRCGLYRRLNPSRLHLLPSVGLEPTKKVHRDVTKATSLQKCGVCGFAIGTSLGYCGQCGSEQVQFCAWCASGWPARYAYCGSCGKKLTPA